MQDVRQAELLQAEKDAEKLLRERAAMLDARIIEADEKAPMTRAQRRAMDRFVATRERKARRAAQL